MNRHVAVVVLGAGLAIGCGRGEPDSERWMSRLADCPRGDADWSAAIDRAEAEGRVAEFRTEVLAIAEACPDRWEPRWIAGESCMREQDLDCAVRHLGAAVDSARAADDRAGVARSANTLGWTAYATGELDRSEALYREALAAAEAARRTDLEAFVRNNLAALLLETGRLALARDELGRAERLLQDVNMADAARGLALNRAVVLLELGNANAADGLLRQVLAGARAADDRWTADAAAVVLGNMHRALDRPGDAAAQYRTVTSADPALSALAALGLGRVALLDGRTGEAAEALDRAARTAAEPARFVSLLAETFLAEAERRAGKADEAERRLDRIVVESDASEAATTAWAARWVRARVAADSGRTEDAIRDLERAVAILEGMGEALDPMAEGLHLLRERNGPYVDLALARRADPPAAFAVVGKAHARALRRALAGAATAEPSGLAAVAESLRPDEMVVQYLLGDDRGILIAVTPRVARAHEIPGRRALGPALGDYRRALTNVSSGSGSAAETTAGAQLTRALLAPVADLLADARRLFVVPDAGLAGLPFSALPDPRGAAGGMAYLGQRLAVGVLPLAGPLPRDLGSRGDVVLAGHPTGLDDAGFAELPWAAFELSRLGELYGERRTTRLTGDALTLAAVEELAWDRVSTIHFATHAVASTRDPRRCGVILSNGETLGLDQILRLRLASSLVVLSACNTGGGEIVTGEGVVGLAWAFLRAGAGALVVSQWTVDDRSSARLMVDFHRRLESGQDVVEALAEAGREASRSDPHPAHWAPFVLVLRPGDGSGGPQRE